MPVVYVLFWFDVEDYLTPESDDALAGCIEVLESHGVRGTFKLVGEKLRVLKARGRSDILESLKRQDVGYHTNFHSVHPTPAEYLEGLGWQDGIDEFERRERAGFDELAETFGRLPSCYGQPGDSWAPQPYGALRRWGVPLYLDEANHVGLDDRPFWYCGMLSIFRLRGNTTRYHPQLGEAGVERGIREFDELYERLLDEGGGVISIYYHPCEYATSEFWDALNFAGGRNPPRAQWRAPEAKAREEMERELRCFGDYVRHIVSRPDLRVVTARDAAELFADGAAAREFSQAKVRDLASGIGDDIAYHRGDGYTLSPAESMYLVLSSLARADAGGGLQTRVGLTGPVRRVAGNVTHCSLDSFLAASEWALQFMDDKGRVPDALPLPGGSAGPADFFATANHLVGEGRKERFPLRSGRLLTEKHATGEDSWGWVIFPEGFDGPEIIELAKLQTWSLKPALAR